MIFFSPVYRAVYLSGGLTMLPGFAERLEKELTKLAPPGVPVEVNIGGWFKGGNTLGVGIRE